MGARIERITFTGSQGAELAARLDLPAGPPRAFALFAHCFTCGKDIHAASRIANALTDAGFGVLRFDFTGLGMSDGEFANTDFTSNTDDLVAAADWLRTNHRAPQLLIGHSLGGSAVLAVAGSIAEVRAVATIGAPSSTEHVTRLFSPSLERDRIGRRAPRCSSPVGRSHPSTVRRRSARSRRHRASRRDAQGTARAALTDRQHRRHRQRGGDLPRRPPSEELRVARWCRPLALGRLPTPSSRPR